MMAVSNLPMRYELKLTTLTPVHIGDGRALTKKEWILLNGRAHILDMPRLLRDGGVRYTDFIERSPEECARRYAQYVLDARNVRLENMRDIRSFIKDAYGAPYIPGSSVKGALRTCLGGVIQPAAEPVQEPFWGLSISDSSPLSVEDLALCQKVDVRKLPNKRTGRRDNPLPIFRECLQAGVTATFGLTVDPRLFRMSLEPAIDRFYRTLYDGYWKPLYREYVQDYGPGTILIGGGTGFETKVTDPNTKSTVAGRNIFYGQHTFKATRYRNELVQMGLCRFALRRVE